MNTILPTDCWHTLSKDKNSYLVDVRNQIEWETVGVPNLKSINKKLLMIPLLKSPGEIDESFIDTVTEKIPDKDAKILFICKTDGRSHIAAQMLENINYMNCYYVLGGFIGYNNNLPDTQPMLGWKDCNLPWEMLL